MASTSTTWTKGWKISELAKGIGVIVEGTVKAVRVHSMFLSTPEKDPSKLDDQLPTRFYCWALEVNKSWQRTYSVKVPGVEIIPGEAPPSRSDPKPIELSSDQLCNRVASTGSSCLPDGFCDSERKSLYPNGKLFEFWADFNSSAAITFKQIGVGETIRVYTLGDSVFVQSVVRLDAKSIFKEHSDVGSGWAGKIMERAEDDDDGNDDDGDDDDGWSD